MFAVETKASSTFWAVLAEVSKNINPFASANFFPSSEVTCLLASKSALLPEKIHWIYEGTKTKQYQLT